VRGFRQLFVISHDDTFEQATQNLIRVERVDGVSRVLAG
jgi:exonuclease SbcC